jgi:hypothetical protein
MQRRIDFTWGVDGSYVRRTALQSAAQEDTAMTEHRLDGTLSTT